MAVTEFDGGDTTTLGVGGNYKGKIQFQRAFDARALHLPLLAAAGGRLRRGYLYQDPTDPLVKGSPLGVQFLYNPTTVQVGYSLDMSRYPPSEQGDDAGSVGLVGVPGSTSVSFDLIFDRTYECWESRSTRGVRYDIEQLERVVGYSEDQPFVQAVAIWVVFGSSLLQYYGFFQGFQVLYTNWTQGMVPTRCAVSGLSLQVLPTGQPARDAASTLQGGAPASAVPDSASPSGQVDGTGRLNLAPGG